MSYTIFTFKIDDFTCRSYGARGLAFESALCWNGKKLFVPMTHARITLVRFSFQAFVHPIEACITCREAGALSMTVRFYLKISCIDVAHVERHPLYVPHSTRLWIVPTKKTATTTATATSIHAHTINDRFLLVIRLNSMRPYHIIHQSPAEKLNITTISLFRDFRRVTANCGHHISLKSHFLAVEWKKKYFANKLKIENNGSSTVEFFFICQNRIVTKIVWTKKKRTTVSPITRMLFPRMQ